MHHTANCKWITANCSYKETHEYCPHPEHTCTCKETEVRCPSCSKHITSFSTQGLEAVDIEELEQFLIKRHKRNCKIKH